MNIVRSLTIYSLLVLAMTGCSTVRVKPLKSADTQSSGIRFYRPDPYLLIAPDGKQSIVYLPDRSVEYAVSQSSGIGSRKLEVTLNDGWNLTKIGAETGAPTDKALDLLAKAIGMGKKEGDPPSPTAGLYRFLYDSSGKMTGLERIKIPHETR